MSNFFLHIYLIDGHMKNNLPIQHEGAGEGYGTAAGGHEGGGPRGRVLSWSEHPARGQVYQIVSKMILQVK